MRKRNSDRIKQLEIQKKEKTMKEDVFAKCKEDMETWLISSSQTISPTSKLFFKMIEENLFTSTQNRLVRIASSLITKGFHTERLVGSIKFSDLNPKQFETESNFLTNAPDKIVIIDDIESDEFARHLAKQAAVHLISLRHEQKKNSVGEIKKKFIQVVPGSHIGDSKEEPLSLELAPNVVHYLHPMLLVRSLDKSQELEELQQVEP